MPEYSTPRIDIASSLAQIQPSRIRELADVAFGMDGVLKLHFGESNLPTPQFVKDALAAAANDGQTYYSENGGLPSLRAALAEKIAELHGVDHRPGDRDDGDRRRDPGAERDDSLHDQPRR